MLVVNSYLERPKKYQIFAAFLLADTQYQYTILKSTTPMIGILN